MKKTMPKTGKRGKVHVTFMLYYLEENHIENPVITYILSYTLQILVQI
jgi:hypothetical protein